jgi:hypothetical protein
MSPTANAAVAPAGVVRCEIFIRHLPFRAKTKSNQMNSASNHFNRAESR